VPYYLISDFRAGLDTRRLTESSQAGTLRDLENGFVNAGGEVEKLQGFVREDTLSAALAEASTTGGGWIGPARTANGGLLFAGPGAQPSSFPNYIGNVPTYWSTQSNNAQNPAGLSSADVFGQNVYLVVQYDEFTGYKHFYGEPGQTLTEVTHPGGAGPSPLQAPHIKTIAAKVFRATTGAVLGYSEVNDPTLVAPADGGGVIDVTTADGAIGPLQGLGVFRDRLAVFGTAGVQLWQVDPDPAPTKTYLSEVVGGFNVAAGKTITTYDSGDVLFLTKTGVRSLAAQSVTNAAAVDDTGTPIDDLVRQALLTGGVDTRGLAALVGANPDSFLPPPEQNTLALVEPLTGQYWLAVGGVIFVLSRFKASNVLAWSRARLPNAYLGGDGGYIKGAAAATDRMVICTEDDTAYLYGGRSGLEYDDTQLTAVTPFLDFGEPATDKQFFALDLIARGRWTVEVAFDPGQPDSFETVGTFEGSSTRLEQLPLAGRSTHLSLRLTTTDNTTLATLSKIAVHFGQGRKA
jgi:hypothetical protein